MQTAQQRMVSLEQQLHGLAADLAQLTSRHTHTQSSAGGQPAAAADSALKQRLRKVELTVAGQCMLCLAHLAQCCSTKLGLLVNAPQCYA